MANHILLPLFQILYRAKESFIRYNIETEHTDNSHRNSVPEITASYRTSIQVYNCIDVVIILLRLR